MCDLSKDQIFNNGDHFSKTFFRLHELKLQQKICDVTLVFNQQRLKAHSSILAGCSNYFYSIFLTEKEGTVYEDVHLDSVNSNAVSSLVDYCYTGTININEENVYDILSAGSLFQLQPVIDACLLFMESSLSIKNCLEIFNLSKIHSSSSLEELAIGFIQANFVEISESEDFLNIDVRRFKEILKNDFLNISSEDQVFDSVMRWVKHDGNRKKYITDLVECLRLPHLTSEMLFEHALPFCGSISACTSMMLEAIQIKLLPNKKNILSDTQLKERSKLSRTLIIVGSFNQNRASIIEIYNPFENKWRIYMNAPINKRNFGAVLVDKNLYIVGGYSGLSEVTSSATKIDIETRETKLMPSLQTARTHIIVVHLSGSLYVPGGRGNTQAVANLSEHEGLEKPLASMERWDIDGDRWHYSTPMITPRECYGVAVLGNEFYVIGGWSEGIASDKTEAFCPKTAKWRQCAPMSVKRNWPGVGSLNGYLYAVGGRSGYNAASTHYSSVEKYDPQIDKWTIVSNFRVNRYAMGVGSLGNKLITIGGATDSLTADVDEYDPETQKWKSLSPLLEPREQTNVISVPISYIHKKLIE